MFDKILKKFDYHKNGFEGLKMIHKIDRSIIPLCIMQSFLAALFPYIELYISAYMIDVIIAKNFVKIPFLITGLIISNLLIGLLIDLLNNTNKYKAKYVQRKMVMLIKKKALEIDFDIMEDTQVLQKISNAEYTMEHKGGYDAFIMYYRQLLEAIFKIITSVSLVILLCFIAPSSNSHIINVFASMPFSLAVLVVLTAFNMKFNKYVAIKSNNHSAELFKKKMIVERKFDYYTDHVFLNYSKGKDIRIFNMFEMIHNNYNKHMHEAKKFYDMFYYEKIKNKETCNLLSNSIYMYVAYIIVILKVLARSITIGELTKYIGAISIFNTAVISIIDVNQLIKLQTEFIKVFTEFINMDNKKQTGSLQIEKRKDNVYDIEFHDVSFKYSKTDDYTLKHVSCRLTVKNKIAVVGKNGAGKTTFIKLLCRLYDPTEGYITLNGIDIKQYDYDEYLSMFSVAFQDFNLFAFPVRENVATNRNVEDDKVWKCLSLSGIADRVKEMPRNIETNLYKYDEDGVEISGGEAQKIAISRALYKDAPFVILDEPTSALDPISEFEIYSKFNELVEDKTSIFISHRMSSCRFCDDIIVFDSGKIIQRGNHNTLIKDEKNVYASLYMAQAKYYKTETESYDFS
ncbi:ATP-binding cassette, subfamily B [Clostridium acidisoli DSM 12555]|uniref:ATP-binding cassette, subfamily B n=1 Tax=Clostridium acidisoli DSM 12555 TaxID=1121291 RepID=A0A1W1XWC0_9CLOT|nr:ABC transporter ATP-binding protein [Clostridium acidisoli]SMC27841.1 ATP-binding cassette, subfamily B [Clostridium acidisoli DSM 12555]